MPMTEDRSRPTECIFCHDCDKNVDALRTFKNGAR